MFLPHVSASRGLMEISPLCVLDFYVVEGHQRGGLGKGLFDAMLRGEGQEPHQLGYDRPSPKFIGFLRTGSSISEMKCIGKIT